MRFAFLVLLAVAAYGVTTALLQTAEFALFLGLAFGLTGVAARKPLGTPGSVPVV